MGGAISQGTATSQRSCQIQQHSHPCRVVVGTGVGCRDQQLTGPESGSRFRVTLFRLHQSHPAGLGHLHDRGGALIDQSEAGFYPAAERILDGDGPDRSAGRGNQGAHGAFAPVSEGAQVGLASGSQDSGGDCLRDLGGGEGSLEGIGRDQDPEV